MPSFCRQGWKTRAWANQASNRRLKLLSPREAISQLLKIPPPGGRKSLPG
jgi:hypothetical protein